MLSGECERPRWGKVPSERKRRRLGQVIYEPERQNQRVIISVGGRAHWRHSRTSAPRGRRLLSGMLPALESVMVKKDRCDWKMYNSR